MTKRPALQALIFDLDGTLIDSLADLSNAVNAMLQERGHPTHDFETYTQFIGDGVRQLIQRALPPSHRHEAAIDEALSSYQAHYAQHWNRLTRPFAGIPEALQQLKAQGLRLGCISNKPDHFTQLCCAHFFPEKPFEVVFGQREGVPRKPDPAGGLEAAALMGLEPAACGYVGDSGIDMEFAQACGMLAIGVTWGFRSRKELQQCGADHLLEQPADLPKLLEG